MTHERTSSDRLEEAMSDEQPFTLPTQPGAQFVAIIRGSEAPGHKGTRQVFLTLAGADQPLYTLEGPTEALTAEQVFAGFTGFSLLEWKPMARERILENGSIVRLEDSPAGQLVILDFVGPGAEMRYLEAGRIVAGGFQPAVHLPVALLPATLRTIADMIEEATRG